MNEIDLNDIKPEDAIITIGGGFDAEGNPIEEIELRLRKITLDDEAWLKSEFGKEANPFNESITDEQLCRIAFHQLTTKGKQHFAPVDVTFVNDDTGEAAVHRVGGWRLFRMKLAGLQQKIDILNAVLYTAGVSRPMLEKIMTPEELKRMGMIDQDNSGTKNTKKKRSVGRR